MSTTRRPWRVAAGVSFALYLLCPTPSFAQQEPSQATTSPRSATPLTLDRVLESLHARHPALRAAQLKQQSAEGKLRSAGGAFDFQVGASGELSGLGKKAYGVLDVTVMQPTTLWGLNLFAGWVGTYGAVPVYKDQWYHKVGKQFTGYKADPVAGEFGRLHAGVALPLLRDGSIDKARAERLIANAKVSEAEAALIVKLLDLELKAAETYWSWVAAGMQVLIAERLLETAVTRQAQVEEKVKQGADAPIYAVENRKYILKRQKKVVESTQKLQETAIKLSQYWRPDDNADPEIPGTSQLVDSWPDALIPDTDTARAQAERAAQQRPQFLEFEAKREAAEVYSRLYTNQLLPRLDLTAAAAQPFDPALKTDLRVTLGFETPLQRRGARGSLQAAEADIARIDAELRVFQDQTVADVLRALVALEAAKQVVALAEAELDLTIQLEEAERIKLQEGDSTLLVVNLREQATADSAMSLVDAQKKLQMAFVKYQLTIGRSLLTTNSE